MQFRSTETYVAPPDLALAVNAAVTLERPLLVKGEPGTGKTALAEALAQLGGEVTLIEDTGVGGAAVLTDCVPSKTLIATAEVMTTIEGSAELGLKVPGTGPDDSVESSVQVDLAAVNARVLRLAHEQSADIAARLERDGVQAVKGRGRVDGTRQVTAIIQNHVSWPQLICAIYMNLLFQTPLILSFGFTFPGKYRHTTGSNRSSSMILCRENIAGRPAYFCTQINQSFN